MIFLSYDDAKKSIHKLKIPSSTAFFKLDKIPERIPKSPASTYKKQGTWVSWGDFLGTNTLGPNDYVFANYDVFNRQNDAERRTFEDIFWKRMFNSYAYKRSNVYDRQIIDYKDNIDLLLEAEEIKNDIFTMEHDLWHF